VVLGVQPFLQHGLGKMETPVEAVQEPPGYLIGRLFDEARPVSDQTLDLLRVYPILD